MPEVLLLAIALAAGAAAAGSAAWLTWGRPLSRAADACRARKATDLSCTIPEVGPPSLQLLTRTLNDMGADFQEVLLLFANLASSARESADLLRAFSRDARRSSDARHLREVLADLDQIQSTIRDFRYFRVCLDDETIRDVGVTGVRPPHTLEIQKTYGEQR